MKLTEAQRSALTVLAEADEYVRVEAWKQSTTRTPIPRINMRAADSLVQKGLARRHWSGRFNNPYVHDDKYSITEAGRAWLGILPDQPPTNPPSEDDCTCAWEIGCNPFCPVHGAQARESEHE